MTTTTGRIATVLAAGALAASALAGCNNATDPATVPTVTVPAVTPTPTDETAAATSDYPPQIQSGATYLTGDSVTIVVAGSGGLWSGKAVPCNLNTLADGGFAAVRCDLVDGSPAYVDLGTTYGDDPCHMGEGVGAVPAGYLEIDGTTGKASFGCPTDALDDQSVVEVAVGQTVQRGDIQCTARPAGFACLDGASGAAILATVGDWKITNP